MATGQTAWQLVDMYMWHAQFHFHSSCELCYLGMDSNCAVAKVSVCVGIFFCENESVYASPILAHFL